MSALSPALVAERLVSPLDWCRRGWFRWLLRSHFLRATLVNRDRRIATLACVNVVLAAIGALYLPTLLFTLGPVLLGVAHVASDVRYLVLRGKLARWWQNVIWLGCLALFGLRALAELQPLLHVERLELAAAAALGAVALLAGARQGGSILRAASGVGVLVPLATVALNNPGVAQLVVLHAHNLVGLLAWAVLFRVCRRWLVGPLLLIFAVAALLTSGVLFRQTLTSPFAAFSHLHVLAVAAWVAPFANVRTAIGLTTAYVFLQSVHYSVWLSWIPQEQQQSRGTPTYRMSVRSLFADLGTPGVVAIVLAAAAVLLAACFDLHRARSVYLSLATFHGYVELALLAFFWVRGVGPAQPAFLPPLEVA